MAPRTILVTNRTNIRYLSGFSGTAGYLLLHGRGGFLLTDSRYHLVAKSVLPRGFSLIDSTGGFKEAWQKLCRKLRVITCGFEGADMTVQFRKRLGGISPRVRFVDVGDAISRRRIRKTDRELTLIRKAQTITDAIFCVLKNNLRVGWSERHIAWEIERLAHEFGADDISFPPIVGINEHSASPHHHCTDRKLKKGDLILIDMGVIYRGYCSDMTRMLFTKTPTAKQAAVYNLVLRAQQEAMKHLRAGVRGKRADAYARDIISAAGFGKNFGHSLGHGVGLDIHELPSLAQTYTEAIPAGAVVTVEPGIYVEGEFGVRLEDMVIVEDLGRRNITRSPKAIQECVIRLQ